VPHWAFELNSAPAVAETKDLKGQILRYARMWSWIILMYHLWIYPEGKKTFTSSLAYLVQTRLENASFKVSLLLNIKDIPSVYSPGIQLCVGYWIHIIQIKFHIYKLCNMQHTHKITAQLFFFIIKPTTSRCNNFTNLIWHENLHVSDSPSSVVCSLYTLQWYMSQRSVDSF